MAWSRIENPTLVENVAHWAVVQYNDLAQVRLYRAEIFDVCAIPECTVLPVIPSREELSLLFQPVDDRVCILLDGSCEHHEIIPFADFTKEVIAVWSLVYVVEDGMLRGKRRPSEADRDI